MSRVKAIAARVRAWGRLEVPVTVITLALLLGGAGLFGAALWGIGGWEAACLFWGACLLAAGLSEVVT